ncbi:hypothetical protein G7Y29_00465 [Corynebacterium qintianiae]|uniref:DUF559 domain-containing protein n=1 Tax=Corynebacterium qintianiae TaxID=2709392 RepID=A0A7T0KM99_9CORY|nr:hypothetical protein [Corynebacterium qintianiae]QPK83346.1 hypothetical protein G7Y29_00465 [Corynebacterium qintianiae]
MQPHNGMPVFCPWDITQTPGDGCVRISRRRYLPALQQLENWVVDVNARAHPRGTRYPAPAAARAFAHALEWPGSVITGFSALAVYRLPYLVEGHDTTLSCAVAANTVGGPLTPTVVRLTYRPHEVWTVKLRDYPFRIASPAVATVQALKAAGGGVLPAVQLIDCVRRHLGVQEADVLAAGRYRLRRPWLEKVWGLSSALADSPKETEMRLLARDVARQYSLSLREQYPVRSGGRLITVFDFALLEPRIGLMYDGQHHWEYSQRQKDSLINLEATANGWTPLRFSSATLIELPERLGRLLSEKCWG